MSIPETIPIAREEGYHTDTIGRHDGGQFLALVTAALPLIPPDDWQKHKRYYAVLHRFDLDGNHLGTDAWFAGTADEGEGEVAARAWERRDEMVRSLGGVAFGDVDVKLFSVEIDGHVFGLVDATDPEEGVESVELLPDNLAFFEPWDGSYDT